MNIDHFYREYANLNETRRESGLTNLFDEILSDTEQYEDILEEYADLAVECGLDDDLDLTDEEQVAALKALVLEDLSDGDDPLVLDILATAMDFEQDDYFGTEGLDI